MYLFFSFSPLRAPRWTGDGDTLGETRLLFSHPATRLETSATHNHWLHHLTIISGCMVVGV